MMKDRGHSFDFKMAPHCPKYWTQSRSVKHSFWLRFLVGDFANENRVIRLISRLPFLVLIWGRNGQHWAIIAKRQRRYARRVSAIRKHSKHCVVSCTVKMIQRCNQLHAPQHRAKKSSCQVLKVTLVLSPQHPVFVPELSTLASSAKMHVIMELVITAESLQELPTYATWTVILLKLLVDGIRFCITSYKYSKT